jgi:Rod binding domain-containing protein
MPDESSDSTLRKLVQMRRARERLRPDADKREKLKEACKDFEAVFINKIWKQMRSSVPKDGYLHSKEEDMYVSMFDWEMSRKMSSAGGIGLGDMLYEQLSQTLRNAGSETGGPPPRVPDGAPIERGLNRAVADEKPPRDGSRQNADQGLMNEVDALAREIERKLGDGSVEPSAGPPLPDMLYRGSGFPRIEAPMDGRDATGVRIPGTGDAGFGGVSFSGREGAAVAAAMDGKVSFAGRTEGLGHAIVIDHPGGWRSVYGNLGSGFVAEGDVVRAGRKIAELSDKAKTKTPELHFELSKNGRKMDPEKLMQILQASRIAGKIA